MRVVHGASRHFRVRGYGQVQQLRAGGAGDQNGEVLRRRRRNGSARGHGGRCGRGRAHVSLERHGRQLSGRGGERYGLLEGSGEPRNGRHHALGHRPDRYEVDSAVDNGMRAAARSSARLEDHNERRALLYYEIRCADAHRGRRYAHDRTRGHDLRGSGPRRDRVARADPRRGNAGAEDIDQGEFLFERDGALAGDSAPRLRSRRRLPQLRDHGGHERHNGARRGASRCQGLPDLQSQELRRERAVRLDGGDTKLFHLG